MEKKVKIKQPQTNGVAKVPVVMQLEALECGAASLTMVLAYYDKWIPLEQVRQDCGVNRDGSSAIAVVRAARSYGMVANGYRYEVETLKKKGTYPCILHWGFNHFVVLDGFKGDKAYLNDPARGTCAVSMEEFDENYTGICILLSPSEAFRPSGKPKSVWKLIGKRLTGLKVSILMTVLTTVITSLLSVIEPVFSRIFYDRLLTGQNPDWLMPFMGGLAFLYLIELAVAVITVMSNERINGKMTLMGNLSYMWKVLHLPMHFFSQRMTGDILSRQSGNATVSATLVNTVAPLFLNSIMMVFYFTVMVRYSWILTLVGITTAVVNIAISQITNKRRVNFSRVQMRDSAKLQGATVAGIQMIETIKASGAEEGFFQKWSGYFASVNSTSQKFVRETQGLTLLSAMVSGLSGSLITGIGVWLTMQGSFTLGSIMEFQGFFTLFLSPVNSLIGAGETFQTMRVSMERIDDVMEYPDDPNVKDIEPKEGEEIQKLSGSVEIKNITFGYSPLGKPLIENFSMSIPKGGRVAFVGASGCGKSTLSKLISGMYAPWSGDILFDGKHVNEIDHGVFTGSLSVVDQDIILFEDTVANNIKMWDNSIEDFEMILAAKDAQLHYDIAAKPDGYQHRLSEGGRDFSGGQRQRLEIARVLAQEPNIIIMDEATSALDAKTEYEVVKAIEARGITCIIIAHRLSTIRDCGEIVVLDRGKVVERGTHEELMAKNGYYTRLISNE